MTPNQKLALLRLQANACIERIEKEHYYPRIWDRVKNPIPPSEAKTREEILKQFQDFWEALPDSPEIRTGAFFPICDLAEEYCFGETPTFEAPGKEEGK
jgi:hypothetical protein